MDLEGHTEQSPEASGMIPLMRICHVTYQRLDIPLAPNRLRKLHFNMFLFSEMRLEKGTSKLLVRILSGLVDSQFVLCKVGVELLRYGRQRRSDLAWKQFESTHRFIDTI